MILTFLKASEKFILTNGIMTVWSISNESVTVEYDVIRTYLWTTYPSILILGAATIVGTAGNVLTLLAIATFRKNRNEENVFLFNLAVSDLFVTMIADPMSILGKIRESNLYYTFLQNINVSNTDGSFNTAISNSFLSP